MENSETLPQVKITQSKMVGTRTLIVVGFILVVLGLMASFFFSQTIEKFFWEARTKSVTPIVQEGFEFHLDGSDLEDWQEAAVSERIEKFTKEIKSDLPNVAAIKIFTINGTLAWTDLKNVKAGYLEPGIEMELKEIEAAGHMVKSAGDTTKNELNKNNLLEVWAVMKSPSGATLGYSELYFDSSDITAFITQIQYSIAGSIFVALLIILFLLRLTFRQQNDIIVRQAHELSDIFEQSPVGIYTIDQKGIVTSINPKMLALVGEKNPNNILGQSVFSLERIKKMNIEGLIREALIGVAFDKETSVDSENGETLYRHYRGTPLREDDGKTVGQVLFTVEDITERKNLEKELALHTETLEKSVAERTKNLQEKIDELEQFQRLTVGREVRMTELKQEIEKMRVKLESMGVKSDTI